MQIRFLIRESVVIPAQAGIQAPKGPGPRLSPGRRISASAASLLRVLLAVALIAQTAPAAVTRRPKLKDLPGDALVLTRGTPLEQLAAQTPALSSQVIDAIGRHPEAAKLIKNRNTVVLSGSHEALLVPQTIGKGAEGLVIPLSAEAGRDGVVSFSITQKIGKQLEKDLAEGGAGALAAAFRTLGRTFDASKTSAEAVPAPPPIGGSSEASSAPSGLSPPNSGAGSIALPAVVPDPSSASEATVPLTASEVAKAFDFTRRLLTRPEVRKFIKKAFKDELTLPKEEQERYGLPDHIKEMSESQLMLLLAYNKHDWPLIEQYLTEVEKHRGAAPKKVHDKWEAAFKTLLKKEAKLLSRFRKLNDPAKPMRLEWPDGRPGYANQKLYANHQSIIDGKVVPASDLKKVAIDFIRGANKELMFNVFDFDLMEIADAMIEMADKGVKITGGIYKKNIDDRPEVKAVFKKLAAHKNITMVKVDSVGLNHQKIMARDYSDEKLAAVLLSSGNFTQSCIGPEGDLPDVPADKRPKESVPNANHMITMDSYLVAQVVANNMIKTLEYGLRGNEYPLGGAFKVFGPKPAGAAEAPYVVLSFSPKGGIGDVNRDFIRRLILETRGILRILVFAFSSQTILDAIVERAQREWAESKTVLDLKAVGDTPFTLRPWAVLLSLAGRALKEGKDEKKYVELKPNALRKLFGDAVYEEWRKNIRVAPPEYKAQQIKILEVLREISAKLHHKVFISGLFAIVGTSFNPSDNAEHNNEQILVTNDPVFVGGITGAFDGFFALSTMSVVEKTEKRNAKGVHFEDVGEKYSADEAQATGKFKPKTRRTANK